VATPTELPGPHLIIYIISIHQIL